MMAISLVPTLDDLVLAGATNVQTGKTQEKVKLLSWVWQQNWCCTIAWDENCNVTAATGILPIMNTYLLGAYLSISNLLGY